MSSYSDIAGTHLSLSWFNALLYSLEIVLAANYFSRFTTPRPLKGLLMIMLVADTICMLAIFASVWMLLLNTQPPPGTGLDHWTTPVTIFMTTISGVIEEVFLINRCRKLSLPKFLTAILLALVVTHAGFSVYSAIYVVVRPGVDSSITRYATKAAGISACLATSVDVFIPFALSWQLFKVTPPHLSRKRSLRDTAINLISSGCFGGIMGVILIVLFATRTDVFYIAINVMGRIYGITLFVNLFLSKSRGAFGRHDSTKARKTLSQIEIVLVDLPPEHRLSITPVTPGSQGIEKELPKTPVDHDYIDVDIESEAPPRDHTNPP
ncbi:hypothetical protein B0H34DRAFT_510387 [Crassisporium funariophilum]|nr:hypothetical protein B0H34DRAFT_510387 [Crassisporium funariophilum]